MKKQHLLIGLALALIAPQTATAHENSSQYIARTSTLTPVPYEVPKVEPVVRQKIVRVQHTQEPLGESSVIPQRSPEVVSESGLAGSIGYARAGGNCVNEPGINRQSGNPISWSVLYMEPRVGSTALWTYNHTGVVTGIWSNGDIEVRHQNYGGSQHRFPRSSFRGFR